ncbi:MAG: glycosyltransferase [Desulfuromonadaceae bacterium]|nr:glycosyltransferase [Desulfuromonadaceae bacterium]
MKTFLITSGTLLHFLSLLALAFYGLHRLWLLLRWRQVLRHPLPEPSPLEGDLPHVTVQLPLYNERFVAARLLDAVAGLDWPADRLEIQVLDDSTDETCQIVDERVADWQARGVPMRVLRRDQRSGYKAGAMAAAMVQTAGEFIAVFDADFVPPGDFLRRLMPYFSHEGIAVVQARWGFLNATSSWLTRVQALLLGPHFGIEHQVRFRRGLFFNFNGTAGIWRRHAIDDAGGWQADTVTEDLDLSYRAQLRGWQFVYVDQVAVPSELPESLGAFRSQQQRWAKGSIQTARKILPRLLATELPWMVKKEAMAHLLANLGWLFGAVAALTVLPVVLWRLEGGWRLWQLDILLFVLATGAILLFFFCHACQRRQWALLPWLPLLPVVTLGLAPSLSLAALQGLFRRGGEFVRTPKRGTAAKLRLPGDGAGSKNYLNLILGLYALIPVVLAWHEYSTLGAAFLLLFPAGFLLIFFRDLVECHQS